MPTKIRGLPIDRWLVGVLMLYAPVVTPAG